MRAADGACALVETKGREDRDAAHKAAAAEQWRRSASEAGASWRYVFAPQAVVDSLTGNRFADLARACAPALENLLSELGGAPEPPLAGAPEENDAEEFYSRAVFDALPERAGKAARDALDLYRFFERKADAPNFAPVFAALFGPMDEASKAVILTALRDKVPAARAEQDYWFDPHLAGAAPRARDRYRRMAGNLERGLVFGNPVSVIGLLRSCLDFALNDDTALGGVFAAVRAAFAGPAARDLLERMTAVNDFRNRHIAHPDRALTDRAAAERNLKLWVETLALLPRR